MDLLTTLPTVVYPPVLPESAGEQAGWDAAMCVFFISLTPNTVFFFPWCFMSFVLRFKCVLIVVAYSVAAYMDRFFVLTTTKWSGGLARYDICLTCDCDDVS